MLDTGGWMDLRLGTLVRAVVLTAAALCCNSETFTAVTHFKPLIELEHDLGQRLQAYIAAEERQLAKLKQLSEEVQKWTRLTRDDFESHLGHPTNAFRLVRRFTSDWREVESAVTTAHAEQKDLLQGLEQSTSTFPDEEDLTGAMVALMRLQDVYLVNTTHFADGVAGPSKGASLSIEDLYLVARSAYNKGEHANCKKWMQEALRRIFVIERVTNLSRELSVLKESAYDHLSFSEYKLGNTRRAYRLAKILVAMNPENGRYLSNKEQFLLQIRTEILSEVREFGDVRRDSVRVGGRTRVKRRESTADNDDWQYWNDFEYYKKLCREPVAESSTPDHQLICFYNNMNRNPRLLLNPAKMEIWTVNPTLVIFRDVIRDSEIAKMQEMAKPKLARATAHNRATGKYEPANYRVAKSAWLAEYLDDTGVLATVNQRIEDVTGLSMSTAEDLQVGNYGIGGHYEPHFDFARRSGADMGQHGNRIATVLFYLSEVAAGGCTVFPRVPARVVPSKGDASFWFNLLPSGKGDEMTRHAGCPVLSGSKWVCNKWIHEHAQEFRRPCKLTEDAQWDIHIPPDHV